ncbi:MAG: AI-2E family transporter [Pseudomonadota bacterium]
MALPVASQLKYWGIAAALLAVVLWFLGNIIFPFVLGGAIAYCLDPLADWLERRRCSRLLATIIITLFALFIFAVAALAVLPTLTGQAVALFNAAPQIFSDLQAYLETRLPTMAGGESVVDQSLTSLGQTIQARGADLINTVFASVSGIVNVLVLVVITPVVAFYLLLDWDNMVARIDDLLPRDHRDTVRQIARDIDGTLASFIRGQGTVCLILGTFYAVALMFAGLNFGIVVGALAGLISFIPYVGAVVGGALSIGLALFQFWGPETVDGELVRASTDWVRIGVVAGIFAFGQFFEGNILSPNLVGSSVGLHPVWLIFALSVFGAIFGFVGMLVAVPLAAMIGVVARFLIVQYKAGRLYRGLSEQDPAKDA